LVVHPLGGALAVGRVRRLGADALYAEQREQVLAGAVQIVVNVAKDLVDLPLGRG
jgi:hypothetical protein